MATRTLDVTAIRKDFPIFETGIAYLDSANTSQRPRQVTGAMLEYFEKFNSNIHPPAHPRAAAAPGDGGEVGVLGKFQLEHSPRRLPHRGRGDDPVRGDARKGAR